MPRKIVKCEKWPENVNPHPGSKPRSYEIEVITPIFGGGTETGVNDPVTLIRPSSIRGHLRFWWRATRGANCASVSELRHREGEIWGTTDNPSPVCIEVEVEKHDESFECASYKWDQRIRHGRGGYRLIWSEPFWHMFKWHDIPGKDNGKLLESLIQQFGVEWVKNAKIEKIDADKTIEISAEKHILSLRLDDRRTELIVEIDGVKANKRFNVRIEDHELNVYAQNSSLPYVLFPFQGKAPDSNELKDPSKIVKSARFKLIVQISSPNGKNIEKDVEAAIWAWVNFGGIGARSRRGCGTLYCIKSSPHDPDLTPSNLQNFDEWLKRRISHYGLISTFRDWPTLGRFYLSEKDISTPIYCWEECISILKDLRQGVNLGRDLGPGRSRWPEPESVRTIAAKQKGLKRRPPMWHPPDSRMPDIAFPRAEFGMPIILEIRRDGLKPTLQHSEDHDRMASPLILRPIEFNDGRFASMIVRLNTPPLDSAYLKPGKGKTDLVAGYPVSASEILDPSRSSNFPESPRHKFCPKGCSALDAFVKFAQSRGFVEVIP